MALRIALWFGVVLLVVVGLAASAGRIVHVADATMRMELVRREFIPSIPPLVPDPDARLREFIEMDASFGRHPVAARLHAFAGALFLMLAPLQFVGPLRRRFVRVHRWTGRMLLGAGLVGAVSGLYFGLLMPFAGPPEAVAVALVGGLFLFSMGRALLAIRAGDVRLHREWMLRAFAVALGISTVRLVGGPLDIFLTPSGASPREIFLLAVWLGWVLPIGAAEIWIRRSRYDLTTRIA